MENEIKKDPRRDIRNWEKVPSVTPGGAKVFFYFPSPRTWIRKSRSTGLWEVTTDSGVLSSGHLSANQAALKTFKTIP